MQPTLLKSALGRSGKPTLIGYLVVLVVAVVVVAASVLWMYRGP